MLYPTLKSMGALTTWKDLCQNSMKCIRTPTLVKTILPEPKWKPLLDKVDHDELIFQRHRAELLEPESLPVEHGGDAGDLVQGLIG